MTLLISIEEIPCWLALFTSIVICVLVDINEYNTVVGIGKKDDLIKATTNDMAAMEM